MHRFVQQVLQQGGSTFLPAPSCPLLVIVRAVAIFVVKPYLLLLLLLHIPLLQVLLVLRLVVAVASNSRLARRHHSNRALLMQPGNRVLMPFQPSLASIRGPRLSLP